MNPMPEIVPLLKQLRLSSILETLESRNRQAIENKLSYMDFLATLVSDEIARRTQKRFSSALRRANQKTLEEFDFTFNPNINRTQILDLASCRFMEEKVSVLIVGPCGTGKSHIAQALGHCALRAGYDVLFTPISKMLAQMNGARAHNAFDRHFAKLAAADLLIIDDFGLKPLQGSQDEDFHDVVAERYERKSTIVTSNLDVPEWAEAFPNRILGAATIDRLRHGAYKIVLDGKSYRSPQPPPKVQNATPEKRPKPTEISTRKGGEKP
jgi:DNA replication protein DnaC